ncbi:MAG: CDP-alcohol phosphatidyltransferase family protein [Austwickia sp.]|nr:CDP-alcohol phosphatidyltransferase family protein [Austwickia sp.]MBK8435239.1 CDP-alcohol phosphatidyltransferase family protein [Austwickia sp.]MBK9101209.1 CDP-alcohol phosphatidyltransferase family protein [Austwickia sp.]
MKATGRGGGSPRISTRVWTIPNALTILRIACVPAFLILLARRDDGWAFLALALSGISDYLDGWVARRYQQVSRLGQLLDPLADRLFIVSTVLALAIRQIVPWWLVAAILARDLVGALAVWTVRRRGFRALPTHFLGKAATFCLLVAFPLLLLGHILDAGNGGVLAVAWAFAWWGVGLYWVSMAVYLLSARTVRVAIPKPTTRGLTATD